MTASVTRARPAVIEPAAIPPAPRRGLTVGGAIAICALLIAVIGRVALTDRWTLQLDSATLSPLQGRLNDLNNWVGNNQDNPIFVGFFIPIRNAISNLGNVFVHAFAQTDVGRQLPQIGWLGVVALVTLVAFVVGNIRVALLAAVGFVFIGLQGLWVDAMLTFALVVTAVIVALLIGIPLGIWAGVNDRVNKVTTPVLDFMQTLPTYAYLAPLALVFSIGPAAGVIATIIFAGPPAVRITAHGIRQVPLTTLEATASLGVTGRQRLRGVLLPMAKRTIVIGINQTTLAALAMVTVAVLIGAPGLGQDVLQALQSLHVGQAFNAGLAIVIMGIVLDRTTTAASVRAELGARAAQAGRPQIRRIGIGVGVVGTLVAIYLSTHYLWAAVFPGVNADTGTTAIGGRIQTGVDDAVAWVQNHLGTVTLDIKNGVTSWILNPLQDFLSRTPFFIVGLLFLVIAFVVGGVRPAVVTVISVALIVVLGLWQDAMATLASVLLGTVFVMILGIAIGVWMGRSKRADQIIRPFLDAAQTMPAFVYLVPFVGLFGSTRFTGIVAAVVYAAPVAIKVIADGIAAVAPTTIEAALSCGTTTWQLITKVQIPMARRSVALAANQGLIFVLSMVVVAGLVGGGGLGYDVVAGLSQTTTLFGKGLAAGLTIVVMGMMLDRITQSATGDRGAPSFLSRKLGAAHAAA